MDVLQNDFIKLKIIGYKENTFSQTDEDGSFSVQFNPSEYSLSHEVVWESEQADGQTDSEQKFKKIKPSDLQFSFVIDGTGASGEKIDAVEKLDEFMELAYKFQGDKHKPRYLRALWGRLDYKGVLSSVGVSYTLFKPNGQPLRVKVDVKLSSYLDAETQVAENQPASPDMTHMKVVKDGDNLPLMTYEIYGDSKYYLDVARVNKLINYRKLTTGQKIYFPPLKEVEV